ncbi:Plasma membrane sulfite pump involved in sulfite metabolism [Diplodia seriata]
MNSPGSSNPSIHPQIDRIPVELCPHGNGSQAVGLLQPFNAITPEISEKPSAASSESGDSVLEQPHESEGPWWMSMVHNFTPSWVDLPSMTAVWLLPAATPIVTASNGATIASMLASTNQQHALWTLMVSYVLWGIGLPMAVVTLGIYFHRLTMHKLPPRDVIITVFMPVGPLGQASFTIMNLGKMALKQKLTTD